mgnify:CR=1 FL=1
MAVIALILFLCCTLLGTLLRGKLHSIYMALMFGGLLAFLLQADAAGTPLQRSLLLTPSSRVNLTIEV